RRNRREFYTGSHGRFGRQNEFSNRQQRVAKMFTMLLPLHPQSAPCFSRFSFTESASANYTETNKMECKPNPLIKLRILCNAQCGAKVASLAAFGAHFDANPDAASGVAFDATHDANFVAHFVAKSSHTPSAAYAAN